MSQSTQKEGDLEQRIRSALNGAKMALWELNVTQGTLHWTGKVASHFYEFAASIDGTVANYVSLLHQEDIEDVAKVIQISKPGDSFFNQHRVLFPDGQYHWLEGIGKMVIQNDDLVMTGTVQDITEKKKLELEGEDWKQKHELVATSAGIVVYEYTIETGKIEWSGSTRELFGCDPDELGDIDSWEHRIHKRDREGVVEKLDESMAQMKAFEVNYRFIKKDGNYAHVHDKGIFLGNEKATKMLGMMEDVTESKRAEFALMESESRFKSMIHDMNIGIGLWDENTTPIICNKKAFELLGMSESQFLGAAALDDSWKALKSDGSTFLPEDFPIPMAVKTKLDVREVVMGVYRPATSDWIWLLVDAVPVISDHGELIHVICTFSDITTLREIQNTLSSKNELLSNVSEELRAKNRRLLEFAQIVSHNLRSPISSIVSLSKIFIEDQDALVKEAAISHIKKVSENALETIDDLNNVLKIQQEHPDNERIQFNEVYSQVLKSMKGLVREADAQIITDFQVLEIQYPRAYLESIFFNLLSNSLKYCSNLVQCQIKASTITDPNGNTILEWSDNGIGLDLDRYGKDVFTLGKTFHQHSESRGVGLFLIKNQVNAMGGSITVQSKPGRGATFRVNFTKHLELS